MTRKQERARARRRYERRQTALARRGEDRRRLTRLGTILGVVVGATGPLLAPFFLRGGFERTELIATKAVCQVFNHLLKIVAFSGLYPLPPGVPVPPPFAFGEHLGLIVPMAVATIFGTATGSWLLERMGERLFVVVYKVVLTAMAAQLLAEAIL